MAQLVRLLSYSAMQAEPAEISDNCCVGCGLAAFAWYAGTGGVGLIILPPSGDILLIASRT